MAYKFVASSSQNITIGSAIVTDTPFTVSAICQATSTSLAYRNIGITNSDGKERILAFTFYNGAVWADRLTNDINSFSSIGTFSVNTFFQGAGVYSAANNRVAWLNGVAGTAQTATVNPSAPDRSAIGGYFGGYLDGQNAEVAIWSAALTDDEIISLSKGFKPTRIRPQSLVFYAPLLRNLQDVKGALTLTNNNSATVADHPRVY